MTADVVPFDVCGPLPEGTVVLEASAGTGKTFTIAGLVTRYVAEGHAELSEVMAVTFSRAATQELRERVRARLSTTERGLADPPAARADADDDLLRHLASASDEEIQTRRRRLAAALAGFDAATIATTHGFCQQMLAGLGMAGDREPDATFVDNVDDLVREVVDDVYLRTFAPAGASEPTIGYGCARKVAREAIQDRQAVLVPDDAEAGSAAQERYALAYDVRREVDSRKRARRLLDYDDLLTRLRDALHDPARGPAAQQRLRSRYRVVLVDEFQDTDPVQWDILRTAFHGHTTLVLIGDPKQAVYAFRGADLVTYLTASGVATTRRTLARNWRSDADLLAGLQVVFGGAALGHEEIVVRPVDAAHAGRRLTGGSTAAPVRLRVVGRDQVERVGSRLPATAAVRSFVAEDLAADIVGLLDGPARLALDGDGSRGVRPGDIAVLVRTNDQAVVVRDELAEAAVPAVLTGSRSVFLTRPAREWLVLLHAVEQPHRAGLLRAAALTCFLGWTATRLDETGDAGVDELGARLRGWRDVLSARGVAALLEVVTASEHLTERLLAGSTGDRDLTDLRHIGQALHAATVEGQLGPAALVEWLQRRVTEAAGDADEERSRRLETDADAVQVVTIHSSKGLEFPVVYVPFGWDRWTNTAPDPLRLHADDGTRQLDVGGPEGPGYEERRTKHQAEEAGEELRLLYVAVTRAMCQVVTWWAPTRNTEAAALHRLLFGEFEPGEQPRPSLPVPEDRAARRRLDELASRSAGTLAVEPADLVSGVRWVRPAAPPASLHAARFRRRIDSAWGRTSYSGLTRAAHEATATTAGVASEPEAPERQDELDLQHGPVSAPDDADSDRLRAVPSPMADLPAGAAFGTLVHQVLETLDTAADDLAAELLTRCREAVGSRLSSVGPADLAVALLPVLETPLGPLAPGLRLCDVAPSDRLAELDFELPLAGGDHPATTSADLGDVADVLRRHLSAADPLAGYPDALSAPVLHQERLRGYLTGSVDTVLRLRDLGGEPRYVVVDYKTNWLGSFGTTGPEPLTAWDYRPAALTEAMLGAHYPLQALLYSVALHRFLRWRQPGYEPDRHLGGVLYLFLRGMCGAATPVVDGAPCGVFGWRPPAALVEELSDLLAGGVA